MGGLVTDTSFRVLGGDYKPIPGLYANGNVVGRRFGGDYPTTCPGISHGMALTFGRLVGQNAAKA
jgi:predicted oxidoreductase